MCIGIHVLHTFHSVYYVYLCSEYEYCIYVLGRYIPILHIFMHWVGFICMYVIYMCVGMYNICFVSVCKVCRCMYI